MTAKTGPYCVRDVVPPEFLHCHEPAIPTAVNQHDGVRHETMIRQPILDAQPAKNRGTYQMIMMVQEGGYNIRNAPS